ncbi:hypothetical protein G210_2856 [Candida maltosa Xu316]|uniref:Zn(2)-C6 fungal-type domain-containing protein n=1 Tax=Candida maltosa (strain Xu316) TaxID=1245528 RepID=M3IKE0_CANMX|nr:hypothetical protein G210_2856 [Candida maltosa Xu316]
MSHNIKQIQKPKPLKIYGRSHYACTRCKLSKLKCSGEKPACSNCKNINKSDECIYPSKDRKIVIMESDLNKLHEKVQELENTIEVLQKHDIDTPNNNFNLKFCQFFFENTFENFEIQLYLLKKCLNNMPEKSYSLILIEKVYCTYNQEFYLIDLNEVNQLVDKVYELAHQFSNQLEINIEITQMSLCYFFILIAFGEQLLNISSNITGSTEELINSYPGIEYYQYAEHLFRLTRRNNDMTFVQCAILLGLYSANLARYTTVGNYFGVAARSAVSQGYHRHREHSSQCSSASEQVKATNEKIKRLWWTVFVIDTTWCTKTVHFQYTDTDVNLPCENIYDLGDFFDLNTLELNVHLTKYVAKFIRLIFGPNIRTFSINYINTDDFNQNQQLKNIKLGQFIITIPPINHPHNQTIININPRFKSNHSSEL